MDYKKLLTSVLPQINYNVGNLKLIYNVEYIDVNETVHVGSSKCVVKFNRVDENKQYSVANKVLCGTLNNDYYEISKYLGNVHFMFLTEEDADLCK